MAALGAAVLVAATACEPEPSPWRSELVSVDAGGTQTGNGKSGSPVFSPDGTKVAFHSAASDLGATDTNGTYDIYVRDLPTGVTTLLTTDATGTQAANGWSDSPVFSPDGTRVAFRSEARDLGPTDTNGQPDVYVRDLATGATELVSVADDGSAGSASSSRPVFSPDGTKVAFASDAPLVRSYERGDGVYATNVFVHDLVTGTTTAVSVDGSGTTTADANSYGPAFSPDGRRIAFVSSASDLGPTDTNGHEDLYVRDLVTGTTELVTADVTGTDAGDAPTLRTGEFSPDGATLYFDSGATNLVTTPDANGRAADVFSRDLTTGTTTLLSANEAGTASADGQSSVPILSADGTTLAFISSADDLGPTDTNGHWDAYVRDLTTGETTLVSAAAGGDDSGNSRSRPLSVGPDGTRVAFASYATDLGPHDSDATDVPEATADDIGNQDIYVRDLTSGRTTMVSTNAAGTDSANHSSTSAVFAPDGTHLAFVTSATDLGYTDRNGSASGPPPGDVYVAAFRGADLTVALEADRATVTTGGTIAYRVEVTNAGPDAADATEVGVLLPEASELGPVEATGATCTSPEPARPNLLACDVGSLPPGAGAEVTVTVTTTSSASGTLSALAAVTSETSDPDRTGNSASVDVATVDESP